SSPVKHTAKNTVFMDYDLRLPNGTQLQGKKSCSSEGSLGAPRYYGRTADNDGSYRHENDPDAQLFDWLADQVWQHYKPNKQNYVKAAGSTAGSIDINDSQGPCRSCRNVFKAFKKEYPNVTITIRYPASDKAHPTAPGLGGGVYGYADAVYDKGMWVKVL